MTELGKTNCSLIEGYKPAERVTYSLEKFCMLSFLANIYTL